jgi:alkylhydroperoxidase family enzyme
VWEGVRDDWRTAPVPAGVRATLGFLEKLTLRPDAVTAADADAVREAGVSDEALVDAIHVCALFSMIVRLADALGWEIPPFESFLERADAMLASGYTLESG